MQINTYELLPGIPFHARASSNPMDYMSTPSIRREVTHEERRPRSYIASEAGKSVRRGLPIRYSQSSDLMCNASSQPPIVQSTTQWSRSIGNERFRGVVPRVGPAVLHAGIDSFRLVGIPEQAAITLSLSLAAVSLTIPTLAFLARSASRTTAYSAVDKVP